MDLVKGNLLGLSTEAPAQVFSRQLPENLIGAFSSACAKAMLFDVQEMGTGMKVFLCRTQVCMACQ